MKLKISKRFVKDSQRISDQRILAKLRQVFLDTEQAIALGDIPNLQLLTGYPNYYRIRFDYRYRVGVYCDGDVIEFLRVGTREDFYNKFP
jgi:mRNA-degrading endonuclease RelE of RelBE toxin-antitoxin system